MEQEEIKSIPSDRLQFFPIMMFAIVMGLAGLTLVFKKVSEALYLPSVIYTIMMIGTTIIFFIITFMYLKKIMKHKHTHKRNSTIHVFIIISLPHKKRYKNVES